MHSCLPTGSSSRSRVMGRQASEMCHCHQQAAVPYLPRETCCSVTGLKASLQRDGVDTQPCWGPKIDLQNGQSPMLKDAQQAGCIGVQNDITCFKRGHLIGPFQKVQSPFSHATTTTDSYKTYDSISGRLLHTKSGGQLKDKLCPETGELQPRRIDSTGISPHCSSVYSVYMTNDSSSPFMSPGGGEHKQRNVLEMVANHTVGISGDIICKSAGRDSHTGPVEGTLHETQQGTRNETLQQELDTTREAVHLELLKKEKALPVSQYGVDTRETHHIEDAFEDVLHGTQHDTKQNVSLNCPEVSQGPKGSMVSPDCTGLQHPNCKIPATPLNGGGSNYRNRSMSRSYRCDKALSLSKRGGHGGVQWRCAITGLPITVVQMLRLLVLLMTVHTGSLAVQAQDLGPRYKTSRRICLSDIECNKFNKTMGEVCWWAWDGCNTGECMCDPSNSFHDTEADMCRPVKYGKERCEEGDRCWEGMTCREGRCRCEKGTMTSDKMFCLGHNERLLGQQCSFSSDVCYQRATHGYTKKEVSCSYDERCRCDEGYKEDGPACRKWNVNEAGCDEDHHCQGGALCVDNICQCPSRYLPVARDSKCAKIGAKYDLQIGEMCDEINEERYCAFGLVCHQCAGDTLYSCVKFVEAEALPYQLSSASHPSHPSILSPPITLLLLYITFQALR